MKLSIIIPVYNVEKYIKYCLDSILKQPGLGSSFEVIIVNDGSPDNCGKILNTYKLKYPDIKVISQKNQGLSAARNRGLAISKGDYVWFIDSDDTIEPNCIGSIVETLNKKVDVLQLNYQLTYEDGSAAIPIYYNKITEINSGKEILSKGGLPAPAPFSIYRREFLIDNNLFFVNGLLHEDCEFKPRVTYMAKSINIYKPIVYNYLQRYSGNIKSKFNLNNVNSYVYVINSLIEFMDNRVFEKDCITGFRRLIGLNLNSILNGVNYLVSKNEKDEVIQILKKNNHIFNHLILSKSIKYVIEGIVFKISVRTGIRMYTLWQILSNVK